MRSLLLALLVVSLPACAESIDLIVDADYLVTMNEDNQILNDAAVAVHAGKIVALGSRENIHKRYEAKEVFAGEDRVLMPGLINGHSHMAMTLLRGLADDLELMTWLTEYIFPAEVKYVDQDFVSVGTELACWEMLTGGTTTVVDMYYFPDTVAEVLDACGMRGIVAATVIGQQSPDSKDPAEGLQLARGFAERWRNHERIIPAIGPHAIYTTAPETLIKVRDLAEELGVPISMHMAESESEIQFARQEYEHSTISLLEKINFYSATVPIIGAHVVWPSQSEMLILARRGVGAIHNPTSNMKITAGVAPVSAMQAVGVTVGLGTDGAASNNDLDLWEEMRMAALLQKITFGDPTLLPAQTVLKMATIDGARAIGLGDQIGSIEVGKRADLIQVRLDQPHMQPLYNVVSHLVYVADSQDVDTVIVDGEAVVKAGEALNIDRVALRARIDKFRQRLATEFGAQN